MSYKVPVSQREAFTIYLQDLNGETWAHCDVKHWNLSVRRQLALDADRIYEMHGGPIFALNEPAGCSKHRKFLKIMGFSLFNILGTPAGKQYVYKR